MSIHFIIKLIKNHKVKKYFLKSKKKKMYIVKNGKKYKIIILMISLGLSNPNYKNGFNSTELDIMFSLNVQFRLLKI